MKASESNRPSQQFTLCVSHLNEAFQHYYLDVLAINLQKDSKQINSISHNFINAIQSIKLSTSSNRFVKVIEKQIQRLKKRYNGRFKHQQICKGLKQSFEKIEQESQKVEAIKKCLNILQLRKFNYFPFQCDYQIKDLENLILFMQEKNIDISSDIRKQIHQYLVQPKKFFVSYSGRKTVKEVYIHKGQCLKVFQMPIQVEVRFQGSLQYNKIIQIEGQADYAGTIKVQKCSCGYPNPMSGFTQCHSCSHYLIKFPFSGTEKYEFADIKQGFADLERIQKIEQAAKVCKRIEYEIPIQFEQAINYSDSGVAQCKNHHQCSCKELAHLLYSAKQIYIKITNLLELYSLQISILNKLNLKSKQEIICNSSIKDAFSKFQIFPFDILGKDTSLSIFSLLIHEKLCQTHIFSSSFLTKSNMKLEKSYSKALKIEQKINCSGKLQYSSEVGYKDIYAFGRELDYNKKIQYKLCFEDCRYCSRDLKSQLIEGQVRVIEAGIYNGSVPIQSTKNWQKQIEINTHFEVKDSINKEIPVEFSHEQEVVCDMNNQLTKGHHSCSSCQLWEIFVTNLKVLLEQYTHMLQIIRENQSVKIEKNYLQ